MRVGLLQRVEGSTHRGDVLRRRSAAAADQAGPGGGHPGHHPAEVLGAGGVDELAFDALR
jgi:hypothetical protein